MKASRKKKKVKKVMNLNRIFAILGIVFLFIIAILAVMFSQKRQTIRQNAASLKNYGNCTGPSPAFAQGVCFDQPTINSCANQGLTQYYSETIPASSYSTCALAAYAQKVLAGTIINCCPSNPNYTDNFGACGALNTGTCTTNACIGGGPLTTPDKVPTTCGYAGFSQNVSLGTTMLCCSAPPSPTPSPTSSVDPCSSLKVNANCGLTNTFSGKFCGGNQFPSQCQLGGSQTSLYTCQCADALGNNCHMVSVPQDCTQAPFNTCIAVPGALNGDHCGNISTSQITFSLFGIGLGGNQNPTHKTRQYTLYIKNHQLNGPGAQIINITGTATYNPASSTFVDNKLSLARVPLGQYDIIIHVNGYLNKRLYPINGNPYFTIDITGIITTGSVTLEPGDIAPGSTGDNIVDVQDFNAMLSCISGQCTIPISADLNDDAVVDDKDMQLLLNDLGSIGDTFSTSKFTCVTDPACSSAGSTLQMCELNCTLNTTTQ